ncbi:MULTISPECIES: hypothetical protein [Eikenella]|uniref:Uncharacterized protein n=1 Tax=Eikenella longinqua TaxID=1795827 RepID=A0A1A9S234_9NEIS|nr:MULTISPECIES: hypothetical protein [Eikenella]OAM31116.1 hypothetical protein A7P95_01040 [Eikenella longinqua]
MVVVIGSCPQAFFSREEWQAVENFAAALFTAQLATHSSHTAKLPPYRLLEEFAASSISIRPLLAH